VSDEQYRITEYRELSVCCVKPQNFVMTVTQQTSQHSSTQYKFYKTNKMMTDHWD